MFLCLDTLPLATHYGPLGTLPSGSHFPWQVLDDQKGVAGSWQPEFLSPGPSKRLLRGQTRVLWYLSIKLESFPFGLFRGRRRE